MYKKAVIRVSNENHSKIESLKKELKFSQADYVIDYLLNKKEVEIKTLLELSVKEKELNKIEENIYKRVDSIQKRFTKYADIYFSKIIDNYNFSEQSFSKIIQTIKEQKGLSTDETIVENSQDDGKLLMYQQELKALGNQAEADFITIRDLRDRLRDIQHKFTEKRGGFSKIFEAKLSVEEYSKFFE